MALKIRMAKNIPDRNRPMLKELSIRIAVVTTTKIINNFNLSIDNIFGNCSAVNRMINANTAGVINSEK
tara:strand:- start:354 stop:560 length:207 start_codon:yes stop_codon:yes gene_type:complete